MTGIPAEMHSCKCPMFSGFRNCCTCHYMKPSGENSSAVEIKSSKVFPLWLYLYGLIHIYFILWVIIQYYLFILLLKLFSLRLFRVFSVGSSGTLTNFQDVFFMLHSGTTRCQYISYSKIAPKMSDFSKELWQMALQPKLQVLVRQLLWRC